MEQIEVHAEFLFRHRFEVRLAAVDEFLARGLLPLGNHSAKVVGEFGEFAREILSYEETIVWRRQGRADERLRKRSSLSSWVELPRSRAGSPACFSNSTISFLNHSRF